MEALIKQFFDKKVGDILKVDEGNLRVDAATGHFVLKKAPFIKTKAFGCEASVVGEAFDELHLPLTLRGGFIDELSVHLHLDVFNPGANVLRHRFETFSRLERVLKVNLKVSLQVLIKNVFLVFGAHTTDWSYADVKKAGEALKDLQERWCFHFASANRSSWTL